MTPDRTRSKKDQRYKGIEKSLQKIRFAEHAHTSGFKRRRAQKITGRDLLVSFILMAMQGRNTFRQWSEHLSILTGRTVSRQGIWKRVNDRLTRFLIAVLFDALRDHTASIHRQATGQGELKRYSRVLVQDSTTISLPDALSWCFPGSISRGKKKALLKIQAVYDLLSDRFVHFEVTPYADNDQSRSKDMLSIARKGDLVIRDLGYFALKCFEEMNARNISFISRMRSGVSIHDPATGKKIDLLRTLRKTGRFDQRVLLGSRHTTQARVIALRLPQEQADQRRRKARQDRDRRLNHSQEYYEMLGYSVFITTEGRDTLNARQIAQLYGWRWRIESIFKCWKSHFNLQRIMPQNVSLTKERAEAIIYMMLIFILLLQVNIHNRVMKESEKMSHSTVSLIKLCQYLARHIQLFLTHNLNELMPGILYYCCYDKRKDRMNFVQKSKLG